MLFKKFVFLPLISILPSFISCSSDKNNDSVKNIDEQLSDCTSMIESKDFDTDREKDEAETRCCLEVKSRNEKNKSIDEAIANYDFVTARKYLSCYPNTGYTEARKSRSFFKKDKPGGDRDHDGKNNKYKEYLLQIVKSEISFWLKNDNYNRAKNVAVEAGMLEELSTIMPEYIDKLLAKKDYDAALGVLVQWKFKYDFFETREPENEYDNTYYKDNPRANTFYNQEIQSFNDLVDNVLNSALINNQNVILKKCISLYVPIAVANPKENTKIKSVLRNDSKNAALKKISEQGISIK